MIGDLTPEQLQRARISLGEASSAVGQCCWLLGNQATNRILEQLDGLTQEVIDRQEVMQAAS